MIKKFLFLFFFSGCALFTSAQNDLLVNFSGQQIEHYMRLSFTVHGAVSCSGTEVQRSADNIHFETIGIIQGICGSSSSDVGYTFDDSLPVKNQFNYYRVHFGQLGNSASIKLKYIDYGNGFVIASNPAVSGFTIYFSNFSNQKISFMLFSLQGHLLQSAETYGNTMVLSRGSLSSGIYFMQVKNGASVLYTGKVVFQ